MRGKNKIAKVYKIILFCKNMDDMMHDAMTMHKRKNNK
jgi:hypothetical protein